MLGPDKKERQVRKDLAFWVSVFQYVPRLPFERASDVEAITRLVEQLDEELVELDFTALIEYLREIGRALAGGL
jgi:hypothetical protein